MTKLPDPAPASRMNIIVIIAGTVFTCQHRRHVASREFVTEASSEVGSEARRQRSVTVTLAQTTHLHSARALGSSDYCCSFVSVQVITPGTFSFIQITLCHIPTYCTLSQVFQQWNHLGKSLLPLLGTSVDMDIRTHIHSKFECHFKKFSVELNDNSAPLFYCGGGATSLNVDSSTHEPDQSVLPLTIL